MFEIIENQHYRICQPAKFLKRSWAEGAVIFKVDARETHQLSMPCAHVVDMLEQSGRSYQELWSSLQGLMDGFEPAEVQSQLSQILETLSKLGIIEVSEDVL